MPVMQSRCERAERLLVAVETSCGSGDFKVDPRLRVQEVWQRTDGAVSRATVLVQLTDASDSEEIRRSYHPDRRLIVTTEHPDILQREILFEGYPPVQSSRWDGRVGRESEEYVFQAEHVWERYARDRAAWVYGRQMRSGAIEDGLHDHPGAFAAASMHFTGLPCIFNPDGVGNRAVEPLMIARSDGSVRRIHIFTADDAGGVKWTFATALRYLVWFHLRREGPVFEGNIFDTTDLLAADQAGDSSALCDALAREPVSLTCEASSLLESLALLAEAAGIHITAETISIGGSPRTQLRVWSPRDGGLRELYLVRGGRWADGVARYDTSGRTTAQVLRDNNTYRGEVTWDHRPIVNHALVLGDVKRYELTLPLYPGWLPTVDLDNVDSTLALASKMRALTPERIRTLGDLVLQYEWYRRYHRDGDYYPVYSDVARLWVLNEDGHFAGAAYNRNAPFNNYQPFDFASVLGAAQTTPGGWIRRPRPLRPTLSVGSDGQSLGVWAEVSFNAGQDWFPLTGAYSALKDRAGIHIDCDNPTQITPPGYDPAWQNMWYAIIDGTFRVRVTAVVEGDDRLQAECGPDGLASPTLMVNTTIVRRPQSFRFASRSSGVNVLYESLQEGAEARDDSVAAGQLACWVAEMRQDRQVRVSPVIPWIETGYAVGDRITRIKGRRLQFATRMGSDMEYPAVIERRFILQDGRYETMLTLQAADLPENVF